MQFVEHPQSHLFQLNANYRGAMFAWPVLLNPSLVSQRGWSLDKLGVQELGDVLTDDQFLCHEGQGLTFLANVVDASFVSSARAKEVDVMRMLVSLQNSLSLASFADDFFNFTPFDHKGGGLVFILGTIYRKARDKRALFLPDPDEFLLSKERLAMEVALSNGVPHYRHQMLPAFPLSEAVAQGLRSGVQCWSGWFEEPARCEFDLENNGDVTLALSIEDTKVVYVRFGQDAVSTEEMSGIQDAFVRSAAHSNISPGLYKH